MTVKDIFGLIVRTFGLFAMGYGLYDFAFAIIESAGLTATAHLPPATYATWGFLWVVFAIVIVKNADIFVNFAYGEDKKAKN